MGFSVVYWLASQPCIQQLRVRLPVGATSFPLIQGLCSHTMLSYPIKNTTGIENNNIKYSI